MSQDRIAKCLLLMARGAILCRNRSRWLMTLAIGPEDIRKLSSNGESIVAVPTPTTYAKIETVLKTGLGDEMVALGLLAEREGLWVRTKEAHIWMHEHTDLIRQITRPEYERQP